MQEVNFLKYLPEYRDKKFNGRLILQLLFAYVLILFTIYLMNEMAYVWNRWGLHRVLQQQQVAVKEFQRIAKRYPLIAQGEPLEKKVETLAKTLSDKNNTWSMVTRSKLSYGFSPFMQALAMHTPTGLWLTRIYIDRKNDDFSLIGNSLQAVTIPALMQSLSKDRLFSQKLFRVFTMQQKKEQPYIRFEIATSELKEMLSPQHKGEPKSKPSTASGDSLLSLGSMQ